MESSEKLIEDVYQTLQGYPFFFCGIRVVLGISGGGDSTALLDIMVAIAREKLSMNLAIAHLDHCLRPESKTEADRVRQLATHYGLPFFSKCIDISVAGEKAIEERSRQARYQFFAEVAEEFSAPVIAVAHTANDQAETLLMRLLKGGGIRGLAAIPNFRLLSKDSKTLLIRPLLMIQRADLIRYLQKRGLDWREDSSNQDLRFERNRIRHTLIPVLKEHFNPHIISALGRSSQRFREITDFLEMQAKSYYQNISLPLCPDKPDTTKIFSLLAEPCVCLCAASLAKAPAALLSFIIQLALRPFSPSRGIREYHYQRLLDLARAHRGEMLLPGGIAVVRSRDRIYLHQKQPSHKKSLQLVVAKQILGENWKREAIPLCEMISAEQIVPPLTIRHWQWGEKIRPLGAPGRRKIAQILSDIHLPRSLRERIPLVVDARDNPVWLLGVCIEHSVRITEETKTALALSLK